VQVSSWCLICRLPLNSGTHYHACVRHSRATARCSRSRATETRFSCSRPPGTGEGPTRRLHHSVAFHTHLSVTSTYDFHLIAHARGTVDVCFRSTRCRSEVLVDTTSSWPSSTGVFPVSNFTRCNRFIYFSYKRKYFIHPDYVTDVGLTMTPYPPFNKTSLSRKPCIADKKLLWITIRKSWSLFQNPSWKISWIALWRRNHDDVISGWQ